MPSLCFLVNLRHFDRSKQASTELPRDHMVTSRFSELWQHKPLITYSIKRGKITHELDLLVHQKTRNGPPSSHPSSRTV